MDLEVVKLIVQIINIVVVGGLIPIFKSAYKNMRELVDTVEQLKKDVMLLQAIIYKSVDDKTLGEALKELAKGGMNNEN